MVHKPGPQYCDYSWSGEWGRGSHPVLEGGSDRWEKGWDGFRCFGMVLGEGVTAAWERGGGSLSGARDGGGQPGELSATS